MKNVEYNETGLQCDNPNCDWKDESIQFKDYKSHINAPCPKCGENILTETDYANAKHLHDMLDFVNSLSEDQINELSKNVNIQDNPMLKDFKDEDVVKMTISTHEKITIEKIEKLEE